MTPAADEVASAVAVMWEHLMAVSPEGWARREGGLLVAVTGLEQPTLNGVWAERVDVDERFVAEMLDEVGRLGLPYCLQLRPGGSGQVAELAARRGMSLQEAIPLMVLDDGGRLEAAQELDGLAIRQLPPEQASLHAVTAARGFDVPEADFMRLVTPESLRNPGVRCYVGERDGVAVTTGVGVTIGSFVGILNIATLPEFRGRGFGAAVTARAAADGLADGATWSYLQSSQAGYGVYGRLGYVTVERWDCWISAALAEHPPSG